MVGNHNGRTARFFCFHRILHGEHTFCDKGHGACRNKGPQDLPCHRSHRDAVHNVIPAVFSRDMVYVDADRYRLVPYSKIYLL